jgi:hypothetical protein
MSEVIGQTIGEEQQIEQEWSNRSNKRSGATSRTRGTKQQVAHEEWSNKEEREQ